MGADLICTEPLVMDKGKKPDWAAAEKYLREKPLDEIVSVLNEWGCDFYSEELENLDEARDAALGFLAECQDAYEGGWRNTCQFLIRNTTVWFIAETSWGDSPEGYDAVNLTIDLGAAKAAGFDED